MPSPPFAADDRTRLPRGLREWLGRRLSGPPRGATRQSYRAAIYQLDRLGDFVLTLTAIRRLLARWGEDQCLLVVSTAAAPLAACEFPRTPLLALPTNAPSFTRDLAPIWWRHRPRFRGIRCDRVLCLSHHRDLYKRTALSWIDTARVDRLEPADYPAAAPSGLCLELEAHRLLLARVLGEPVSAAGILPHLTSIAPRDGGELLVCPIGSEKIRTPPDDLLLDALALWRRRSAAPIALNGPAGAEPALQSLAQKISDRGLGPASIALTPGFDAFLARIAHSGAVLAIESGPSHLATALDKRACILNGGGRFGLCSPWQQSARQAHLFHRLDCYGCNWHCTQSETYCLNLISPAAIAEALPPL